MKQSSKKSLAQRGILVAGRAQNAGGSQVHADKRRTPRNLEKQRLKQHAKTQMQHETARNRGPFPFLSPFFFFYCCCDISSISSAMLRPESGIEIQAAAPSGSNSSGRGASAGVT